MPHRGSRNTSVSRHGRTPAEALVLLGREAAGQRRLYGAAMIKGMHPRAGGLDVLPDEPPERHAVIGGWPWIGEDPEQEKAQQKEKALVLASAAGEPLLF